MNQDDDDLQNEIFECLRRHHLCPKTEREIAADWRRSVIERVGKARASVVNEQVRKEVHAALKNLKLDGN